MKTNTRKKEKDKFEMYYQPPRVVIRFHEEIKLPKISNPEKQIEKLHIGPWDSLIQDFPNLTLTSMFDLTDDKNLTDLGKLAAEIDPTYKQVDFSAFYYVNAPPATNLISLVKAFLQWKSVKEAYIDQTGPDPIVNASNDPWSPSQGYLDPAPDGIDARYAWGFDGGDGVGQSFIDLERGWTLNHEDLVAHGASLLHGTLLDSSRPHGTSVLGIICASDNEIGCVGIVPNVASVNVVSFFTGSGHDRHNAILAAIQNLKFGDVLLLEAQVQLNGTSLLGPIEAYDAEFEVIRLATALGIIVVEAGGNGTANSPPALNMDTYVTISGKAILNRDPGNRDFRDSGAIIVSASRSLSPHIRLPYAPYGKRIDCYAWGENITTTDSNVTGDEPGRRLYTNGFDGTSGASPIIAGAALAVQGRAEKQLSFRYSPKQMRKILSNPGNGTLPDTTEFPDIGVLPTELTHIGVLPNLRAIFNNVLNVAPDLYIRDFVGDTGEPHTGAISASPDIILRNIQVLDPQVAFGVGSGTENDITLSYPAEIGQDNYIYVRILNQGGSAATNVTATVYWSPVATLVTPNLWNVIGTVTIPNVPAGEQLTVSNAIVWNREEIPGPGHYCFIGIIGNTSDPGPESAEFLNWDNFLRFIRQNNNVTWRNFNVLDNKADVDDPTVPREFKALQFIAPGPPDKARRMSLEIITKLPNKARTLLEVPIVFYEILNENHQLGKVDIDKKRNIARIPINHNGVTKFGDVLFTAKSSTSIRILIHIPKGERNGIYQIMAKQVWEQEEIGRVTWQIQPRKIT